VTRDPSGLLLRVSPVALGCAVVFWAVVGAALASRTSRPVLPAAVLSGCLPVVGWAQVLLLRRAAPPRPLGLPTARPAAPFAALVGEDPYAPPPVATPLPLLADGDPFSPFRVPAAPSLVPPVPAHAPPRAVIAGPTVLLAAALLAAALHVASLTQPSVQVRAQQALDEGLGAGDAALTTVPVLVMAVLVAGSAVSGQSTSPRWGTGRAVAGTRRGVAG
jgi:hypothetical protein